MGRAAAMGLRKISPSSTMIMTIVTPATMFWADLNDRMVSYCMATAPARPARRPLPPSNTVALSRSTGTALCSFLSPAAPLKITVTSCALPLGASMAGLVTTAATRPTCALLRPRVSAPTRLRSAAVSLPPSARCTTKMPVASAFCGKVRSASCCACIDS